MSAWGDSWGDAWGDAWGPVDGAPATGLSSISITVAQPTLDVAALRPDIGHTLAHPAIDVTVVQP